MDLPTVEINQILSAGEFLRGNIEGELKISETTRSVRRIEMKIIKEMEISADQRVHRESRSIFRWTVAPEGFFRGREIWSTTHFYQDAFEILAHRHAAQFDAEVADLESRPLGLDLRLLFTGVDVRHF